MAKKIGFIGTGNIAFAIINGAVSTGIINKSDILLYDISKEKLCEFEIDGFKTCDSSCFLVENSDVVFLCIKPQNIDDVINSIIDANLDDKVFVTVLAGISTSYIKSKLNKDIKIVRVMPNTPLLIGSGAVALSYSSPVSELDFEFIKNIFSCGAICEVIPEEKMNEIIGVNASSPAFIYRFAKIVVDYAKEQGIDQKVAMNLFCATLIGSAKMLTDSGKSAGELINMVTSPGGTTLKGLEALDEYGFDKSVEMALDACTKRAYELNK